MWGFSLVCVCVSGAPTWHSLRSPCHTWSTCRASCPNAFAGVSLAWNFCRSSTHDTRVCSDSMTPGGWGHELQASWMLCVALQTYVAAEGTPPYPPPHTHTLCSTVGSTRGHSPQGHLRLVEMQQALVEDLLRYMLPSQVQQQSQSSQCGRGSQRHYRGNKGRLLIQCTSKRLLSQKLWPPLLQIQSVWPAWMHGHT
ncbi:hypothetical protein HJG60_011986 [Phyllostomus discolor]|uniref:Secreted protein n=1 Tax=Phyllostomus discolor TaxID=89673 RepID=A0A833ZLY1_9CHIR|nr:hypothetical protein HJG60_011986 [Phyllostomus discolor]